MQTNTNIFHILRNRENNVKHQKASRTNPRMFKKLPSRLTIGLDKLLMDGDEAAQQEFIMNVFLCFSKCGNFLISYRTIGSQYVLNWWNVLIDGNNTSIQKVATVHILGTVGTISEFEDQLKITIIQSDDSRLIVVVGEQTDFSYGAENNITSAPLTGNTISSTMTSNFSDDNMRLVHLSILPSPAIYGQSNITVNQVLHTKYLSYSTHKTAIPHVVSLDNSCERNGNGKRRYCVIVNRTVEVLFYNVLLRETLGCLTSHCNKSLQLVISNQSVVNIENFLMNRLNILFGKSLCVLQDYSINLINCEIVDEHQYDCDSVVAHCLVTVTVIQKNPKPNHKSSNNGNSSTESEKKEKVAVSKLGSLICSIRNDNTIMTTTLSESLTKQAQALRANMLTKNRNVNAFRLYTNSLLHVVLK